jgi:hypothetical protein
MRHPYQVLAKIEYSYGGKLFNRTLRFSRHIDNMQKESVVLFSKHNLNAPRCISRNQRIRQITYRIFNHLLMIGICHSVIKLSESTEKYILPPLPYLLLITEG